MIKINLISKEDRESLKWEKVNKAIISYASKIIVVQAFFVLSLAVTMIYLNLEKERFKMELSLVESSKETVEIKKMEDSLKKSDRNLKVVTSIHQNHIRWTNALDSFSLLVTKGIKINSIRFKPFEIVTTGSERGSRKVKTDDSKFKLEVEGDALKREDLMAFEKRLDEAKIFKVMETGDPAYNKYVNSENIAFSFNFEVSREDLVKMAEK